MPEDSLPDDEEIVEWFIDAAFVDGDELVFSVDHVIAPEIEAEMLAVDFELRYVVAVEDLLATDAAVTAADAARLDAVDALRVTSLTADTLRASAMDAAQRARADRDGAGRSSAAGEYRGEFFAGGSLRANAGHRMPTAVRSREISERSVRAEIGVALGMSEGGAGAVIDSAELLRRRHPAVLAAMAAGRIRERHAIRLVRAVADLPADIAEQIVTLALPKADRAFSKFADLVDRLVDRLHPVSAEERHADALEDRAVWVTDAPDQMAELHVFGPAVDIHAAFGRMRSMAKAVTRGGTDGRIEGGIDGGLESGLETRAAETRTLDQITADVAIDLLIDGETETTPEAARGIRPTVFVTVPALAMATGDRQYGTAEADGIGPIDRDTATRLIGAASEWTRIITHPVTGMVLSVDRERYRPPAAIARIARWAYGTCTFPGCRMPAHRCELDHIRDFKRGGSTGLENLEPLCTGHHTINHATKWNVAPDPGGGVTWTSPGGQRVSTPTKAPWRDLFDIVPTLDDEPAPF